MHVAQADVINLGADTVRGDLDNAGKDECALHRVGAAKLAPSLILVGLHFASVLTLWIVAVDTYSRGGGVHGCRYERINCVVAFDGAQLVELLILK
jgi:hypothetical protein